MRKLYWMGFGVAVLCLAISGPASAGERVKTGGAADLTPIFDTSQGWETTTAGLWQRPSPEGDGVETYATGIDGLRGALVHLKARLSELVDAYLASPTEKRREILDNHMALVHEVEADLAAKEKAAAENPFAGFESAPQALAAPACQRTFSYGTSINRFHCLENTPANASYSTNNPTACPEKCTVHAYSYASATCNDPVEDSQSCTQTGTNVSCATNVVVYSAGSCYLYAFASIHCPALGGLYLYESDSKNTCLCGTC